MDEKTLKEIRRRHEEYNESGGSAYKAFMYSAHRNVGLLLDEVDRLRAELDKARSA